MLFVALTAFFVMMGLMIREQNRSETEERQVVDFYRSEYSVPFAK